MVYLIALLIIAALAIVVVQIGKISEIADKIRGEEEAQFSTNKTQSRWLLVFMIVFLVGCVWSAIAYRNVMLGYGPWESSSEHGKELDSIFNVTLFFTGIVFVLTHIFLFYYGYKYRAKKGKKALFFAHDSKLEMIWTAVPALVMTFLVVKGLVAWNKIMPDVDNSKVLNIEATGYQFAWDIRYAGADNKLGHKDFRLINSSINSLGVDFKDPNSHDDILLDGSGKIVLPVDTMVRVSINAKDVLHNFYLPHFRVKMDAVPGLPTYFLFRPTKTTAQMRTELSKLPEWQEPYDPKDPESKKRWEMFEYELACAELCGKGHYSMRRIVEIVSKEEFATWQAGLKSFYIENVRGKDWDPNKDQLLLSSEISARNAELERQANTVWSKIQDNNGKDTLKLSPDELVLKLKNVFFETGSAQLNDLSNHELDYIAKLLNKFTKVRLEVGGHTDNVGDAATNKTLSFNRANAVKARLVAQGVDTGRLLVAGYGPSKPTDTNDTEEGRAKNRRTELRIINK